ncbi:MAG: ABC transporter ATP-binding protein [Bacteroidota bacterium]|jgi:ABC-type multidrug transport system ATPase subunit|nr:ABC transporter ATP-binding protein [Chitinophagaceae bacterium]MCE2759105.1 ABC transporter ATP-binding protein [Chitinophagaceae bacterium]
MGQNIVEVEGLSKSFASFEAVKHISFQIEKGSVYGFLGQNGAGKSTTMRMLLSLIQPNSGNIRIFGKPLKGNEKSILSNIGAIIEKPDTYGYLSGYDNLKIFSKIFSRPTSLSALDVLLEKVGLKGRGKDKVKSYSQGMKQRLGIAIALLNDPDFIMLDEPTNGLDPQGITEIRNLIGHFSKNEGKTILVSSHLLNEIEMVADSMIILHKGEKIAEGKVQQLLDPTKTIVTIETSNLQGAMNLIQNSNWSNKLVSNNELRFEMDKEEIPMLVKSLVEHDIPVSNVQSNHSLENYFLKLTNA